MSLNEDCHSVPWRHSSHHYTHRPPPQHHDLPKVSTSSPGPHQCASSTQSMQRSGYSDVSGHKNAVLQRLQTGIPTLQFRIDGRECLQRALVVCVSRRVGLRRHAHVPRDNASPNRGDCPWGKKRLGDLHCLMDLDFGQRDGFVPPCHTELNKQDKSGLPAN
jgi:hypothetical protein